MRILKNIVLFVVCFATIASFCACDFGPKDYRASEDKYFAFEKYQDEKGETVYAVKANPDYIDEMPEVLSLPKVCYIDGKSQKVTEVTNGGFKGISSKEVRIPKNIKKIGDHAFEETSIEKVYFYGESLTKSEDGSDYKYNNGVEIIGKSAFGLCKNLKDITLPKTLLTIDDHAFSGCCFDHIDLPDKLEKIGNYSFALCKYLVRLEIPHNVSEVADNAFDNCDKLEIRVSESNPYFKVNDNKLVRK